MARTVLRHLFVFRKETDPAVHIPEHARGVLAPSTLGVRRTLREFVVRALQGR